MTIPDALILSRPSDEAAFIRLMELARKDVRLQSLVEAYTFVNRSTTIVDERPNAKRPRLREAHRLRDRAARLL